MSRTLKRAASRVVDKTAEKLHQAAQEAAEREHKSQQAGAPSVAAPPPRRLPPARPAPTPRKRPVASSLIPDPDVPTPAQTSSHGPFDERSRRDPDKILAAEKMLNEEFAEEDRYTNKSGDPRIGTHGRNYKP